MSRLFGIFSRKKEAPSAAALEHGALLVLLFEEDEITGSDIEKFCSVCNSEGWDYETRVVDNLAAALTRRFAELAGSTSQETYLAIIAVLNEKTAQFGLQADAVRRVQRNIIQTVNNHFLKKLKGVSQDNLAGIEYSVLARVVEGFGFSAAERASAHVDDMLVTLAMASVRSNIKYTLVLLSGESPRFDVLLDNLDALHALARRYAAADQAQIQEMISEVADTIYDRVRTYLLIKDPARLDIYQSREKIHARILAHINEVQYTGPWRDRFEHLELVTYSEG